VISNYGNRFHNSHEPGHFSDELPTGMQIPGQAIPIGKIEQEVNTTLNRKSLSCNVELSEESTAAESRVYGSITRLESLQ